MTVDILSGTHYVKISDIQMIGREDVGANIEIMDNATLYLQLDGNNLITALGENNPVVLLHTNASFHLIGDGYIYANGGGSIITCEDPNNLTGSIYFEANGQLDGWSYNGGACYQADLIHLKSGNVIGFTDDGKPTQVIHATTYIQDGGYTEMIGSKAATVQATTVTINDGHFEASSGTYGNAILAHQLFINGGEIRTNGGNKYPHEQGDFSSSAIWVDEMVMNDGRLYASGHYGAAGIGGNTNDPHIGNITINGGYVDANAELGAATIGSGVLDKLQDVDGKVTINGGMVIAMSSQRDAMVFGPGIGGSTNGRFVGTIALNGGFIFAMGRDNPGSAFYAPSIGSNTADPRYPDHSGTLTIGDGKTNMVVVAAPNGFGPIDQMDQWNGIITTNIYVDDQNGSTITQFSDEESIGFDGHDLYLGQDVTNVVGHVTIPNGVTVHVDGRSTLLVRNAGRFLVDSDKTLPASTLEFEKDAKLTGRSTLNVNGTMILHGGKAQVSGSGTLDVEKNDGDGLLKILLSEDMIDEGTTFTYDPTKDLYTKVYDGKPFSDDITIKLDDLWHYSSEYKINEDYDLTNMDHIYPLVSDPYYYDGKIIVPTDSRHLLEDGLIMNKYYAITSNYRWDVIDTLDLDLNIPSYLDALPKVGYDGLTNTYPILTEEGEHGLDHTGAPYSGKVTWYSDLSLLTPLSDGYIKDHLVKDEAGNYQSIPVVWKYTITGSDPTMNYPGSIVGILDIHPFGTIKDNSTDPIDPSNDPKAPSNDPTTVNNGKTIISSYDDGGPFTIDTCGNVVDRWHNIIYQGQCGIKLSGYTLVDTSDN